MRALLLGLLLAGSAALAAGPEATIHVGDEVLLLPDGPGKGIQASPDAAFGQGLYLVVWREGWHGKGGQARIYAARLQGFRSLDPAGVPIAASEAEETRPALASDRAGHLLCVYQKSPARPRTRVAARLLATR